MDFDFPPDDDPRRLEVRDWIESNPSPSPEQLLDAGYIVPHWPEPYGISADPMLQLIIDDELNKAGIKRPANAIGIGWAGPTILLEGTEEQKNGIFAPFSLGKNSGVKCSANPMPDLILLILLPERFVMVTNTSLTDQKSGLAVVTIHNSEYLSLEQTRMYRNTKAFLTSFALRISLG